MSAWRHKRNALGAAYTNEISRVTGATPETRRRDRGSLFAYGSSMEFRFVSWMWNPIRRQWRDMPYAATAFEINEAGELTNPRGDINFDRVVEAQEAFEVMKTKVAARR